MSVTFKINICTVYAIYLVYSTKLDFPGKVTKYFRIFYEAGGFVKLVIFETTEKGDEMYCVFIIYCGYAFSTVPYENFTSKDNFRNIWVLWKNV